MQTTRRQPQNATPQPEFRATMLQEKTDIITGIAKSRRASAILSRDYINEPAYSNPGNISSAAIFQGTIAIA
jgi:hypothetical protein